MRNLLKVAVASALLTASAASNAGAINVDAGWYGFCFDGVGSAAYSGCQNSATDTSGNTFSFTLLDSGLIKVTDAFNIGDTFDVYVNSVFAFTTSTPSTGAELSDPDLAFASGYYSAGSLLLGAGSYQVDIFANLSPFGGGGAFMEVETIPTPEPGTLALLGLGLLGLGLTRRKSAN